MSALEFCSRYEVRCLPKVVFVSTEKCKLPFKVIYYAVDNRRLRGLIDVIYPWSKTHGATFRKG